MIRNLCRLFFIIVFISSLAHQNTFSEKEKKPFTFDDIMKFKSLRSPQITDFGDWIVYTVQPDRGDGEAVVRSTRNETKYTIPRGGRPSISEKAEWMAFKITPKALELANAKKGDAPKAGMALLNTKTGNLKNFDNIKKYEISNDGKWLIYTKSVNSDKKKGKSKKKKGDKLIIHHLETATEITVNNVSEFIIDSLSHYLIYTVSGPKGKRDGIYYRDLSMAYCPENVIDVDSNHNYSNITWNIRENVLAYLSSGLKKNGSPSDCQLNIWDPKTNLITMALGDSVIKFWYIPDKNTLRWTIDGQRLFFGLKPEFERYGKDKDTTKYTEENFFSQDKILKNTELLIWHWNDPRISTHQIKWWEKNKDRTYNTLYNLAKNKVIPLADSSLQDVRFTNNPKFAIGYDDHPYQKEITYDGWYWDLYVVNLATSDNKLIAKRLFEPAYISPNGEYVAYFQDKQWYVYNTKSDKKIMITEQFDMPFYDIEHDQPSQPGSYGFGGWYGTNTGMLVYDQYDIWLLDLETGIGAVNFTIADGAIEKKIFRIIKTDPDKEYYTSKDTLLLSGYDTKNKNWGLYLNDFSAYGTMHRLEESKKFRFAGKAKYTEDLLISRESFDEFPDLWLTDMRFDKPVKLTDVNPQMKDFKWGTAELVTWENSLGDTLDGFYLKPDDYDSTKRYPVLIYFYEKFSQRMYSFAQPAINHRPCFQQYLSDDYVIFLPDIKYHDGYPGKSSLDALVSGAKKLVELGIADSNAIGIQGHSWGAYEAAYIITQTDYFKAACAGAPVGNMTSAYSGIRLGSGLARQFQYEKTQSRIGGNLWDSLDNYLNNSPVFNAPKIKTPLLMMFGDKDEAVPWQQGIELYLAMRRLNKNCIFLQYEDEPHHLKKYPNKLDYAKKMKEFFDHYLLNKPEPEWMAKGKLYRGK